MEPIEEVKVEKKANICEKCLFNILDPSQEYYFPGCHHFFCIRCIKTQVAKMTDGNILCSKYDKYGEVQIKCLDKNCWNFLRKSDIENIYGAEAIKKAVSQMEERIKHIRNKLPSKKYCLACKSGIKVRVLHDSHTLCNICEEKYVNTDSAKYEGNLYYCPFGDCHVNYSITGENSEIRTPSKCILCSKYTIDCIFPDCKHPTCQDCFKSYVLQQSENNVQICCFNACCKKIIQWKYFHEILMDDLFCHRLNFKIPCLNPTCSNELRFSGKKYLECNICYRQYCPICLEGENCQCQEVPDINRKKVISDFINNQFEFTICPYCRQIRRLPFTRLIIKCIFCKNKYFQCCFSKIDPIKIHGASYHRPGCIYFDKKHIILNKKSDECPNCKNNRFFQCNKPKPLIDHDILN